MVRLRSAARALRAACNLAEGAGAPARKYRVYGESQADLETEMAMKRRQEDSKQRRHATALDRAKEAALAALAADWHERGLLLSATNTEVVSVEQLVDAQRKTLPWISENGWLAEAAKNALLNAFARQEGIAAQFHNQHDGTENGVPVIRSREDAGCPQQQEMSSRQDKVPSDSGVATMAAYAEQQQLASLGGALSAIGTASVTSLVDIIDNLEVVRSKDS